MAERTVTLSALTLRALLGFEDGTQDTLLNFVLDSVMEGILNYSNLSELPAGLENTAYRMVIDLYRAEGYGSAAAPAGEVQSIKEGDTQVNFRDASSGNAYASYMAGILKNYTVQLNRYRRFRRETPCSGQE